MGFSVDGLSSGLDSTSIISKMMDLERRPVRQKADKQENYLGKLNSWSQLDGKLSALQSITTSMNTRSKFSGLASAFSNNSSAANQNVLTAAVGSSATSGTYSMVVKSIAKIEKEVSVGFDSKTTAIGIGQISIQVGSVPEQFLVIDSSNNTLNGVMKAINAADWGVTASILNDGSSSPYRLVISSNNTGVANAIKVRDSLDFGFSESQSGTNATFTIDGTDITSASNTITDAIDGITINLKNVGSGTLSFESNTDTIKSKISDFVNAYNEVMAFIQEQFVYDANKNETGGPLFGNNTLMNIQEKLRGIVSATLPGLSGSYTALSQVGIRTSSDGKLTITDSELSDALRDDLQSVIDLFAQSSKTSNGNVTYLTKTNETKGGTYEIQVSGGVVQMRKSGDSTWSDMSGSGKFWTGQTGDFDGLLIQIDTLTDGSYGTIKVGTGAADFLTTEINFLTDRSYKGMIYSEEQDAEKNLRDLTEQIEDLESRIDKKEARLKERFANMEVLLDRLTQQQSFLDQQFAVLSK